MSYSEFIKTNMEWYEKTLKELIAIPAPSFQEGEIAEYILTFLKREVAAAKYENVRLYKDNIHNVYCEIVGKQGMEDGWFMATAHTDTVFSDTEDIEVQEDKNNIYGLGAKDNRVNVCALMYVAKYIFQTAFIPETNMVFVFDVCEEGLGNLKGCKQAFANYRVDRMIALDLDYTAIYNQAVGSVRHKVIARTKGGHALNDFGTPSAIAKMAEFINEFYQFDVKQCKGKTTYNVGVINGGTSVNTIAGYCEALVEWRADHQDSLNLLQENFDKLVRKNGMEKELLGIRPSMGAFSKERQCEQEKLSREVGELIEGITGAKPKYLSGSTDCNIPLSQGIPAVCFGACVGHGEHTRAEYVEKHSLEKGLLFTLTAILQCYH